MVLYTEKAKRMKELRKKYGVALEEVAQGLQIPPAAYEEMEISPCTMQSDLLVKLAARYKVTLSYMLFGNSGEVLKKQQYSIIPVKAHAGFINSSSKSLIQDDYEFFRIPGYDSGEDFKLFEIEGDSMAPTLEEGDIVICQDISLKKIKFNAAVIIMTGEALLIN